MSARGHLSLAAQVSTRQPANQHRNNRHRMHADFTNGLPKCHFAAMSQRCPANGVATLCHSGCDPPPQSTREAEPGASCAETPLQDFVARLQTVCQHKHQETGPDADVATYSAFATLVNWWDETSPSVPGADAEIGQALRNFAKQQANMYNTACNERHRRVRTVLCFGQFAVLLLGVSYAIAFLAFTFDHGTQVYSILQPDEPQQICFCDTRCQCTCTDLAIADPDFDRAMECHLAVEGALLPYSNTSAAVSSAFLNGNIDESFLNTSCAPVVAEMDAACNRTMQFFGRMVTGIFEGPWRSSNATQWVQILAFLLVCREIEKNATRFDCTALLSSPDSAVFIEAIRMAYRVFEHTELPAEDPHTWGCAIVCQYAHSTLRGLTGFTPCHVPEPEINPIRQGPWVTMQMLWTYRRWLQWNSTNVQIEGQSVAQLVQDQSDALVRYGREMSRSRELLQRRNLCPALADRWGYLLLVTGTSTLTVVLGVVGYWVIGHAMAQNRLPRFGSQHHAVLGGVAETLMCGASSAMADWATWFIDVKKRRHSAPFICSAFGLATVVDSAVLALRLCGLTAILLRTGTWVGEGWPAGWLGLQLATAALLAVDICQALLLVLMVSEEEIEEAGMSYLLIVWTLVKCTTTAVPLVQDFVVRGRHSNIDRLSPFRWLGAHRTRRPMHVPMSPDGVLPPGDGAGPKTHRNGRGPDTGHRPPPHHSPKDGLLPRPNDDAPWPPPSASTACDVDVDEGYYGPGPRMSL